MNVSYSPLRDADRVNGVVSAPTANLTPKRNKETSAAPLLNTTAPIAKLELDDDLDDRETVSTPYPGVDDGFFPDKDKGDHPDVETINPEHPKQPGSGVDDGFFPDKDKSDHPDVETINPERPKQPGPDVEIIPTLPKDPEPMEPPREVPEITPRNNFPGGSTDNIDGKHDVDEKHDRPFSPPVNKPTFPYAPGYGFPYGHDLEVGSLPGEPESSIPDVNVYQHKKTLAQGMMDLALFSANANQLRYVLESFNRHPYYYPSLALISISLILQVAVGIGLIWNATYNVKDEKEICIANRINNFTIIGIFLVTIINVFISAFGVANPP